MIWKKTLASLVCLTSSSLLATSNVNTSQLLQNAIITANGGGDGTINFTGNIDLTIPFFTAPYVPPQPNLRPINVMNNFTPTAFPITIIGNGNQLIGGGSKRGFFVRGGVVTLNGIVFNQTASFGGAGGSVGGGGGAGIGGALIIGARSTVTATDCKFQSSTAQGGAGAAGGNTSGAGGGGGLGGAGGVGGNPNYGGGGGGGLDHGGGNIGVVAGSTFSGAGGGGVGFEGTNASGDTTGNGGGDYSGAGGGAGGLNAPDPGSDGLAGGGGGGGHDNQDGVGIPGGKGGNGEAIVGGGGGGGGGAGGTNSGGGGTGGAFGGGGGGTNEDGPGGAGGFCGGGGAGGCVFFGVANGATGGRGGFGGGGGGGGGATGAFTGGIGGGTVFGGGTGGRGDVGAVPSADGGGGGGAGFGGAIFIQSGGALTLTNTAAFAGEMFSGNSVIAGAGGAAGGGTSTAGSLGSAAGADIYMMTGSRLTFDILSNVNVPNPIAGGDPGVAATPALTKLGCAQLTLNGDNTFVGGTSVEQGELRIDGSVVGDVTVANSDGILSGNFTINGGNLVNNGTLSPGDGGVGQITVNGNFTNGPTGIVVVDITPTAAVHDTITVTGNVNLSGTLNVVVNAGNYIKGTTYTVINGPTNGTKFTQKIETGVNADLIDVDVSYSSVILTVVTSRIFQDQTINGGIPRAVANCMINGDIVPRSDFANVIQLLGVLSNSEVNRALYNLSPVNYGALDWINARNNNYVADILSNHLFELCCSPRDCCSCNCNASVWIDVFGNLMNNTKHYDNLSRFTADAVGVVTGIDYCFNQNFLVGGAFAYTHTWLDWKGHHGNGDINSYYGALYGSYEWCCLEIDVSAIGGGSDHDLKRKIKIQGTGSQSSILPGLCGGAANVVQVAIPVDINRSAKSDLWGYFFTGHLGVRTDWEWCCTTLEPFGLIDYNYFHRESFKEHGANSLNLKVKEHSQNMLRGEAGLRAYRTWVCDCFCFAPYIGLSWVGEFPIGHSKQRASFIDQSCVFSVNSYHSSVQLASPEAGIKWTRCNGVSFLVGYKGLYNGSTSINEVEGSFEWVF